VTAADRILLSEAYEIGSSLLEVKQGQPQVVWQDSGSLRQHAFRAHWSTPVLVDGFLFGTSGRNQPDSDFRCIRMSDGALQWADRRHERSSVLLVDNHLVVLGESGRLELMRADSNKLNVVAKSELNEITDTRDHKPLLEYPCWAAPVLSHGLLFVRGNQRLICMELIEDRAVMDAN
jgi:outer membrane protein assembly factor BamB